MRLRSKVGIGTIALTAIMALGKCSAPLIETAHVPERATVSTPVEPAQPTTKPAEPTDKPKERPCREVVYEPNERCGLERRPWKGGPDLIKQEANRYKKEALRLLNILKTRLAAVDIMKRCKADPTFSACWIKKGIPDEPDFGMKIKCGQTEQMMAVFPLDTPHTLCLVTDTGKNVFKTFCSEKPKCDAEIKLNWDGLMIRLKDKPERYVWEFTGQMMMSGVIDDQYIIIWNDRQEKEPTAVKIYVDGWCRPVYEQIPQQLQ